MINAIFDQPRPLTQPLWAVEKHPLICAIKNTIVDGGRIDVPDFYATAPKPLHRKTWIENDIVDSDIRRVFALAKGINSIAEVWQLFGGKRDSEFGAARAQSKNSNDERIF